MAVLNGQLTNSQGTPSNSVLSLASNVTLPTGFFDSVLSPSNVLVNTGFSSITQTVLLTGGRIAAITGNYQNYQSSFTRFFGEGFKQDASKIYIQKSSLMLLTALPNNTAESLLTALLLQVKTYESNSLISNAVIELFSQSLVTKDNETLIQSTLLIKLYKIAATQGNLSPNYGGGIIQPSSQLSPNDFA